MDKYFNEIYTFITKEDNFEFAYEISEKFSEITEKLRNEFWKKIILYCENTLDHTFKLSIDESEELIKITSTSWNFSLIIEGWNYMEEIFLEIMIDTQNRKKRKELEAIFIDEEFLNSLGFEESEEKSDKEAEMILIKELDSSHMLKKIIPSKRDFLVEKIAKIILEKIAILKTKFELNK